MTYEEVCTPYCTDVPYEHCVEEIHPVCEEHCAEAEHVRSFFLNLLFFSRILLSCNLSYSVTFPFLSRFVELAAALPSGEHFSVLVC